jgi:hypothetical protein
MGKIKWGGGVTGKGIDEVDTSKQFTPYAGTVPPAGVYQFHIKILRMTLSSNNNTQLMIGLELVPRKGMPEQNKYKGYFLVDYIPVMESTQFRVRPFLDAIGVKGRDFTDRSVDDGTDKHNVTKIGNWIQNGKQFLLVSIGWGADQNGNNRMEVKGFVPAGGAAFAGSSEEDDGDDGNQDDDTNDANTDDEPPF